MNLTLLVFFYLIAQTIIIYYKLENKLYKIFILLIFILPVLLLYQPIKFIPIFIGIHLLIYLGEDWLQQSKKKPLVILSFTWISNFLLLAFLSIHLKQLNSWGTAIVEKWINASPYFTREYLLIALMFFLVSYPASYLIKEIFAQVFLKEQESTSLLNIGSFIGILERSIILILGLLNLYSSIALVLTAKSIARFKQLENKDFAEKYLVGTLLSMLLALICLLIMK